MNILIAAGGTGGHIFPALSVAAALQDQGHTVEWATTDRGWTASLAEKYGIPRQVLSVEGFQSTSILDRIGPIWKMVRATARLFPRITSYNVVIAFGGYVCGPVLQACRMRGVPYFLHEQNSVLGFVNRSFVKKAEAIFLGMPLIPSMLPALLEKDIICGTPVRPRKREYAQDLYPEGFVCGKRTILITGGSQGAQSMNEALYEAIDYISGFGVQVLWQTGTVSYKKIAQRYAYNKVVFPFAHTEDMYPYYAVASLVIGRAGAATISESAFFGLPALFIPLPWAADNHQYHNAMNAQSEGWATCLPQADGLGRKVIDMYKYLFKEDPEEYALRQKKARMAAPYQATETIIKTVERHYEA
ncbi:UDP-N-acetylglucosamine--N-acetylmuramyl-(pentapeptide) pyrophosphoryl-undecaprenol N-acetylglucosamine transferase [Chitinivibrio alkaliphilus]|uniref:UDP-N-acetylglucosamine--N-acetylmuramyl-(pentapeptide) pyrophosphoryl-undecaprenol N-acetylglucosamine transferase n=1 Tax=Chitinivibrio alkaliphilus ACht1 TaxID=1313304 RepID=U7D7Y0_9BACT|nr:UDP-N-acetylglucosamine--N-acetylmuramyl-(pentapeptide) pyrophosphoryl-undecaprenol N-acetylglucosamine transferase [Chitinivibrio alkaliphilus]ERP31197.1 undecaprenyldiphospho-muramoylpentapeptide beta-N-acetylglucosaminyltransferase [Chitinivibrio alkaliphilus ACht1]